MNPEILLKSVAAAVAATFAVLPNASWAANEVKVEHVLIVSVDGMHQQDLALCIQSNTCPNIAALAEHGVNYTAAFTPGLSDSAQGR